MMVPTVGSKYRTSRAFPANLAALPQTIPIAAGGPAQAGLSRIDGDELARTGDGCCRFGRRAPKVPHSARAIGINKALDPVVFCRFGLPINAAWHASTVAHDELLGADPRVVGHEDEKVAAPHMARTTPYPPLRRPHLP